MPKHYSRWGTGNVLYVAHSSSISNNLKRPATLKYLDPRLPFGHSIFDATMIQFYYCLSVFLQQKHGTWHTKQIIFLIIIISSFSIQLT